MKNRNNKEFDFDDSLEDVTALTCIELDPHLDQPAELPEVELEREQVTDALDTANPETDPLAAARAIDNAEFNIQDVTPQDLQRRRNVRAPAESGPKRRI